MKIKRFIILLCVLALSFGCALSEITYTDATATIKLHNQYQDYKPTGGVKNGAQGYYDAREFQIQNGRYWCWWGDVYGVDCLEQGGCHAFSYSHAVQWLLQQNLGDEVLHELINVCENPSDYSGYHGFPKCRSSAYPHKNSNTAYSGLCSDKYGLNAGKEQLPERDAAEWERFFDEGRIAIMVVTGHYNVAVDYIYVKDVCYVQILDSAPQASVSLTWGKAYFLSKSGSMLNLGMPRFGDGPLQYWVSMDDFLERYIGVDMALSGGAWQGHTE